MIHDRFDSTPVTHIGRAVAIGFWLLVIMTSSAMAQVSDPRGDADEGRADIIEISAQAYEEGGTKFRIVYAEPIVPPVVGYIFIDLDRNPGTSLASISPVPGIEALVKYQLLPSPGGIAMHVDVTTQFGTRSFDPPKTDQIRYRLTDSQTLALTLRDRLFSGIELYDFFFCSDVGSEGDSSFDRVPDAGVIDISASVGQVKVHAKGNESINVTWLDAAFDSPFPDLVSLRVRVIENRLRLVVEYNHNVAGGEGFPTGVSLIGRIAIDKDKRLTTGFDNGGESPPLLGADHAITFTKLIREPLAASLLSFASRSPNRSPTHELKMGLAFANDCLALAQANKVTFDVPLTLLGYSDGDVHVRCESFTEPGTGRDALPDHGAYSTGSGRPVPLFSCTAPNAQQTDPVDATDGQRNDELLAAAGCLSLNNPLNGDVLLLQILHAELKPHANSSRTRIYLDTDQNPQTGGRVSNADTTIGADFVLEYRIDLANQSAVYSVELSRSNRPSEVHRQLAAFKLGTDGSVSLSLPLSLLDNDDGNVNILVETTIRTTRSDILPNAGMLQIRRP
ncbi:MAG: hypothetical protein RMM98_12150 [Acidobacteriota bacterium]|nr:hypothetical protein [Blastocatellia bacterium]MDW8240361.1 hypothetical protein [Acidobacteriota bacterium]